MDAGDKGILAAGAMVVAGVISYAAWKAGMLDFLSPTNGPTCPIGYVPDITNTYCVPYDPTNPPNPTTGKFSWSGVVADAEYNRILAAEVKLTSRDTGIAYSTHTDGNGEFYFNDVPTAYYDLDITANGFAVMHRPYKNFSLSQTYPAVTYNLYNQAMKLETIYLTKANASSTQPTISEVDDCNMEGILELNWDIVSLLRAKGHAVPGGEVDVNTLTGDMLVLNGLRGWLDDQLWVRVLLDGEQVYKGYFHQGPCPGGNPHAIAGAAARAGVKTVAITTFEGSYWSGDLVDANLQLLCSWSE